MKSNQSLRIQREEIGKLLDKLPSLLDQVETWKISCIIIVKCTVENESTKI